MQNTRYFALILGVVYVALGILGFIPGLLSPPPVDAPRVTADVSYGLLFGLFPVNALHNLAHILFGIWGIAAYRAVDTARVFARSFAIVFGVLTVMGLIPVLKTTFTVMPVYGHDVWLHAISALLAAYFGFRGVAEMPTGAAARPR